MCGVVVGGARAHLGTEVGPQVGCLLGPAGERQGHPWCLVPLGMGGLR